MISSRVFRAGRTGVGLYLFFLQEPLGQKSNPAVNKSADLKEVFGPLSFHFLSKSRLNGGGM